MSVTFRVSPKVDFEVLISRPRGGIAFNDYRVVDRQYGRDDGIHGCRIAAHFGYKVPHTREIGEAGTQVVSCNISRLG